MGLKRGTQNTDPKTVENGIYETPRPDLGKNPGVPFISDEQPPLEARG